ncbi:MAG: nucleotidyltransferase family protein [Oscillospiraceae bacterium]|nr:nucleotidyltransferase family protein [Oscillospiraceae bacterium]
MTKEKLLLALVSNVVCGTELPEDAVVACTEEMLQEVYTLAVRQDLVHLIGQALSTLNLPECEAPTKAKKATIGSFGRAMLRDYEFQRVCAVLETAKIPYIPLKGSVLQAYYPESWMRTSCDVDILVKEDVLETAVELLKEKLGYTAGTKSDHDISLRSASGFLLELHYDTIQERYEVNGCREVLGRIWEHAHPKEEGGCQLLLSDEMFYFYHIAHMAKHFAVGGCGVRPFLDIWILENKMPHKREKRLALLEEGGLLKFALAAEKVSRVWFSGAEPDEADQAVSDYIFRAGLYGDNANRAAIGQARNGGKLKYVLTQRVFMPYEFLKDEYPVLKTHKWLTPIYQVVRWVRMLCSGGLWRTLKELKANAASDKGDSIAAKELIKYLGL